MPGKTGKQARLPSQELKLENGNLNMQLQMTDPPGSITKVRVYGIKEA